MFSKSKKEFDGVTNGVATKPAVPSIISTDMKVVGDLTSQGEIQVDGTVEGDIKSKHLLIGEPAHITGEVVAEVVEIYGTVHGQIKATAVSLAKTAHVVGDILHENLSIEKGAFLEGHCKRIPDKKEANERIALVRDNGTAGAVKPSPVPAGDDSESKSSSS